MEKTVGACLEERFEYSDGSLDFSCLKIELTAKKGESVCGSFQITGSPEIETEVYLYSSSSRLRCGADFYKGNPVTVEYCFDCSGMEEGDVLKGELGLVSGQGEYSLPFVVTIVHETVESSIGSIKNLFHFANLAKSSWLEAVQVFYSERFLTVFQGGDKKYFNAYRGFLNQSGNESNLDEFLIEINKKQGVEYSCGIKELSFDSPEGMVAFQVPLVRNGWGYTCIQVEKRGDFLQIPKERVTDDDFLGNHFNLEGLIDSSRLHAGRNEGEINLQYVGGTLRIPVTVMIPGADNQFLREQKNLLELTKRYLDFRMKKTDTEEWLSQSMEIVDNILSSNENNCAARLFQAQLLITKERFHEAGWILEHVEGLLRRTGRDLENYYYYRYLTTLLSREEDYIDKVTEEVEEVWQRNRKNWKIAWLLLYLKEEISRNPQKRWAFLHSLYEGGCISPVIYLEAAQLMNARPELLTELDGFTIEILQFAVKNKYLGEEASVRFRYLAGRVKEYSGKLLRILKDGYAMYPHRELLQVICTLLVKGGRTDEQSFCWYEMGVREGLRITRLYEHYMLSVPTDQPIEIPKAVKMYFAYECSLPFDRAAYLYADILRQEETAPEMVRSYQNQMCGFVREQIQAGHISRCLSYVYQAVLTPELLNAQTADAFAQLLFIHEVTVENPAIRQVIVIQDKIKGEVRYPVSGGQTQVSVCSADYKIFLQDTRGSRFTRSIPFTLEKLLVPRKFVKLIKPFVTAQITFDLFVCEALGNYNAIHEENAANFERVIYSEKIRMEYKRELRVRFIQYLYDRDEIRKMDETLERMEPEGTDREERAELLRFMVARGMYEKAFDWLKRLGAESASHKTIFRLCSRMLSRETYGQDDVMLSLAHYAFRNGKYDAGILQYLSEYGRGMTRQLRDIWKAARDFEVTSPALCERILMQILYSQAYIGERAEIYLDFCRLSPRADIKKAFLKYNAYEYFVKEKVIEPVMFQELRQLYEQNEAGKLVMLALLKHYSEMAVRLSQDEKKIVTQAIDRLMAENLYFSFFLVFAEIAPRVRSLSERTIVEYRTNPGSRVMIHYVWQKEGRDAVQYKQQEMVHMYGGIFTKSFVLFYGEKLQYYITEEINGVRRLTESAAISKNDVAREDQDNRFSILNDVVLSCALQDYDTLDKLMEEYVKKSYLAKKLFEFL